MIAKEKHKFHSDGFSILEIVFVIAVISILTAISLPNIMRFQDDAKIVSTKQVLVDIAKECMAWRLKGKGEGKIGDIVGASGRLNFYGDRFGLNFGNDGFTFDTSLTSNTPVKLNDTCEIISAKSNTSGGVALYPHFQIDIRNRTIRKDCIVDDPSSTYGAGYCDPTKPAGSQW